MKIKKIRLKNGYKRFHDLTIDLGDEPKRIIALVGSNGCGKSSIFDGMLYINNAHNQLGAINPGGQGRKYEYHSMNDNPSYNHTNIEIDFDSGNFSEVRANRNKNGKANTIFSFRSPYRYNSSLDVRELKATDEIWKNNYGASYSIDLDDKMEANYRRLNIEYNNFLNKNDCKPSEAKKAIIGDLNQSITNCLDLKIANLGDIESGKGSLYFNKPDYQSDFNFNVLSAGEKEVVDIILDLYLRKAEYSETIFLIDEPELHINTSIQRKLLIEINKLIGVNCQIWIATHSIGFLRTLQSELKDDCQIVHFKDGINWASSKQIINPAVKSRKNWLNIFETALDDLTTLVSPERIIYCEGRDRPGNNGQERGLDAIVYNEIFSRKYPETLFISSGGNTELDQRSGIAISILSKVLSTLEILVLKDRDLSSSSLANEETRQTYLNNNPQNHRVIRRFEIENYLFDKEVLKSYCGENGYTFDEVEYDKFVTDIQNQNLKDETGRIKNICGITTSINAEVFKRNLSKYIIEGMGCYKELEECIFSRG